MSRKNWPAGAWSHTQFAELRRCPRAHKLKYRDKLSLIGVTPKALEVGSGFHTVLEIVGERRLRDGVVHVNDWDQALMAARARLQDPSAGIEITRLVGAYRLKYGHENAGYPSDHILQGVEETLLGGELHKDIGGFAAIADGVTHDASGELYIWEHKTAARLPSYDTKEELIEELKVGSQAMSLAYCGWKRYSRIPKVVRNITTKTRVVDFLRVELSFSQDELLKWEEEQRSLEQLVPLDCANRDACAPPTGFKCQFFKWCHGSEEDKSTYYIKRG